MSIPSRFAKSEDAKKAGWFSRRHQTATSSSDAREKHDAPLREAAKQRVAELFKPGTFDKRRGDVR